MILMSSWWSSSSSPLPWWLTFLCSHASSFLLSSSLITFGYVVPALSSIKAVVQRDPEAYTQWVSYWLILHLLNLIDLASPSWWWNSCQPSWLRVPLLLWLSLPRYRGASVLYDAAVAPFLREDFDHVERSVDGKLGDLWRGTWGLFSTVTRRVIVAVLTNGWAGGGSNDLGLMTMATMAWRGYSGGGGGRPEEVREEDHDDEEGQERRLSPHHSLRGSSSTSVVNLESSKSETATDDVDDDDDAEDRYAEDFANLLYRGLYVFALEVDGDVDLGGVDDDGSSDRRGRGGDEVVGGTYKLRVLSYRPGPPNDDGDGVLVLSRVDGRHGRGGRRGRNHHDHADENEGGVVIQLRDVDEVETSGPRNVSLRMMRVVASSSASSGDPKTSIVEVMLSDGEDRDTLLAGLRALCGRGRRRRRSSSFDDLSTVDDGDGDAHDDEIASSSTVPN